MYIEKKDNGGGQDDNKIQQLPRHFSFCLMGAHGICALEGKINKTWQRHKDLATCIY